jgi:hypothetical protein
LNSLRFRYCRHAEAEDLVQETIQSATTQDLSTIALNPADLDAPVATLLQGQ